jgi:DNA repair and recombination protein RAD52
MTFKPTQIDALKAPLHTAHVKQREQGGKTLSYVEAWWAIAEANRIFGFDAWTRETVLLQETNRDIVELQGKSGPYKQWRVGYLAKVRITVDGIVREGTGFGSGMSKPEALGEAIESAAKEAESDAMKRALMTFGNPFGLALYDKTQAQVTSAKPATNEQIAAGVHAQPIEASEYDPEPPLGSNRLSAFEAKRQGLGESIKNFIDGASAKELDNWEKNFDRNTGHLPANWLPDIRERIELRREELAGAASIAEDESNLDEAFRARVGVVRGSELPRRDVADRAEATA